MSNEDWRSWQPELAKIFDDLSQNQQELYLTLVQAGLPQALEALITSMQVTTLKQMELRVRIPDRTFKGDDQGVFHEVFDIVRKRTQHRFERMEQEILNQDEEEQ